ncbi:MAG: glycosyltransferase family 2 protein [Bdellovibrionota bacterium]
MQKLPISLTVITKNEEKNIERCLRSAPFVSEIILIDGESSDKTLELAQKLGANVFVENWQGFGPQKQIAVGKAKYDWILSLDADEALSPELSAEICARFSSLDEKTGYQIPRRSYHLGKWINFGGWFPDRQLRLFNKKFSNWDDAKIHEKVIAQNTETFQSTLLHWVFEDLSHQVQTNNRYSSLQAEALFAQGKKFSFFKLLVKPISKFIESYFLKRGFLDGMPGLIISVSASYSVFLKWAKLWELENKNKSKTELP